MSDRVVIVGGGLAGLAAAQALACEGMPVTVLESRQRLGGRASSFADTNTGQLVDACQHVSMGVCTNFSHFCRRIGIDGYLIPHRQLYFMTPDRRISRLGADPFPSPFHLARGFLGVHFLSPLDKLKLGPALLALIRTPADADPPLEAWLHDHRQSERAIRRFWAPVLVSALNESIDRLGLRYARKVFLDAFMGHRDGFEVHIPSVPLGRLYGDELLTWMESHGVEVRLNAGVRVVRMESDRVLEVELRDGSHLTAEWVILAVPFDRLGSLLPEEWLERDAYFSRPGRLEKSPITSVHLWYDRPILNLPHVVLLEGVGQWIFNRGETSSGHYVQVVISASRDLLESGNAGIETNVIAEVEHLFPEARRATRLHTRTVTEHAATFAAVPGVDQFRVSQRSPISNLFLAGDWTATGWPATMEGAVRSGYRAVEYLMETRGLTRPFVQPDLR